jgi:hypothetical protein
MKTLSIDRPWPSILMRTSALRGAGEGLRRELAALVRVKDFRLAEPSRRLIQRRDTEAGIHRVRQPPGQHLAGRPVHDRDQI